MYSRSMHRESKKHIYVHVHTHIHIHSIPYVHVIIILSQPFPSNLLHSVHFRLTIVSYRSTIIKSLFLSDLSACLSICRSIQLLSALVPLVYLFVDTFTNLLMTSIWSPRIVFVSLKFLRTISNRSFHCTITGHKSTKYKKPIFLEVFLSFFLVFRRCMKIDRRGVFREGNHQFLESCFLESWC